jgi:hypothetical protein
VHPLPRRQGDFMALDVHGRFQPLTVETQRVRGYLPPVDVDVRPIRVRIGTHIIEEGAQYYQSIQKVRRKYLLKSVSSAFYLGITLQVVEKKAPRNWRRGRDSITAVTRKSL